MRKLMACLVALVAASAANANLINITATDQGWYDNTGLHIPGNTNYIASDSYFGSQYRNWFVFNVPANTTILSARLTVNSADIFGGPVTYTLHDVTTSPAALIAGTGGVPAFNDLGSGTVYGSRVYTDADDNQFRTIELSPSAVAALQAFSNSGGGLFALGGRATSGSANYYAFGFSGDSFAQLQISTPEPISLVVFGGLVLGGGLVARKRLLATKTVG